LIISPASDFYDRISFFAVSDLDGLNMFKLIRINGEYQFGLPWPCLIEALRRQRKDPVRKRRLASPQATRIE
jgi:hypothetical protein